LLSQTADPVAWRVEPPPATASVVDDPAPFRWSDEAWCGARSQRQALDAPLSIYEVHAASWLRHPDGRSLDWSELAEKLVDYVSRMGFTHVEFMPVMLHPFAGSWGYQVLGQFAQNALLGTPEEFALLIDRCHGVVSACCSIDCRRIFPPTRMGSRASTERRPTSMPTRARATSGTGILSSTISAATRSAIS
jgi:1,4-alpha-glucan branching enzyme